ncbi:MAG: hypothetical protein ITG03_02710 [Sphingorhabdus sp.]|nr:hypothetical protein [Sphingorhabdus sp.]
MDHKVIDYQEVTADNKAGRGKWTGKWITEPLVYLTIFPAQTGGARDRASY